MNRNCLSYWFPKLVEAGVPVPRTEIVRTEHDLSCLCDGEIPSGWSGFLADLNVAVAKLTDNIQPTPPVFLRTGQGSGKHHWSKTCYLDLSKSTLANHVAELVEWSHVVDFMGLPHDVWVVRELLPVEWVAVLPGYGGMPLVPEVRAFISGGDVVCSHPYWPEGAILDGLICQHGDQWHADECVTCRKLAADLFHKADPTLNTGWQSIANMVAKAFAADGSWSVDLLPTRRGWFVTDMAEAARSFHWEGCPNAALVRQLNSGEQA